MNPSVDLPWALGAAVLLAMSVTGAAVLSDRRHRARLGRLGTPSLIARLLPGVAMRTDVARAIRRGAAVLAAGIAFAGPRWGVPAGGADVQGIDVVIAVDASLSMLAEDEPPSRLARARQEIQRLRALSRGDRIGLIAFAGRSYILTPLTTDDGALALFLDNLDPSIVGQPGSSLASALRQGVDLLGPATSGDRALVVLTDGETFDESDAVLAAARRVRDAGVSLVLVGFGTGAGATIPVRDGDRMSTKRDADGAEVVTRYDAAMLQRVANEAGGMLIDAAASDKATRIRGALAGLQATKRRVESRRTVPLHYHWFLVSALLLFAWDAVAGLRRRAATLALLAVTGFGAVPSAGAQIARDLQRAEAEFRAARPLPAARAWRAALEAGDRSPQTLYNLGTAFLAADSLDAAIEILERTATSPSAAARDQAWYNLGLAYLRRGLATQDNAGVASLRGAVRAYRQVLLAAPADSAARWNYELAMRALQSRDDASGGQGGTGGGNNRSTPGDDPSMERGQAEQLLDAAARDERDTRGRQQPGRPVPAVRGRDW